MSDPIEALAEERADAEAPGATDKAPRAARATKTSKPTEVPLDRHPGFRVHRLGHALAGQVVRRPAMSSEWDATVGNGSGLVNCAAWARRIEAEGLGTGFSEGFLRGLIHR